MGNTRPGTVRLLRVSRCRSPTRAASQSRTLRCLRQGGRAEPQGASDARGRASGFGAVRSLDSTKVRKRAKAQGTGGDRTAAVSSGTRTVRSGPLLVLAAPAAAVVRVGRDRAEDRVRAGLAAAGHLAVAAPGHVHHLACWRGGVRRVRAARLAGPGTRGQRPDPPVRQVVGDLLLRARDGRAGGLPPASPGRDGTGAMADYHARVLPAGPGPGHGHHPRPHAARRVG